MEMVGTMGTPGQEDLRKSETRTYKRRTHGLQLVKRQLSKFAATLKIFCQFIAESDFTGCLRLVIDDGQGFLGADLSVVHNAASFLRR
ncbi:hypothetical protein Q3G72_032860 [Acer saccharum]|nr:hypothetical protein Q3G72_032860 [Acer saccharum]